MTISRSILFRITTDIVLISISLSCAFTFRLFWKFQFEKAGWLNIRTPEGLIIEYFYAYLNLLPIVVLLNIGCYIAFGIYTRGRLYSWKNKLICVLKSVTIAYLLLGLFSLLIPDIFFPRSVLFMSWGFTILVVGLARMWTFIWRLVILTEEINQRNNYGEIRTILVIGGGGYIGSALVPNLLKLGYKVRILDLFLFGYEPILEVKNHKNLEIIEGDLRRVENVVESMFGVDAVIHLGGLVGDPACSLDEKMTIEINLMATRLIGEAAKAHKVQRFIFASTCSVYGASNKLLDEESILNPVSLYAKSKIASERVLNELKDENFIPIILRLGTIYGFSGRNRFDLVVNLLTAKAITDGQITIYGGEKWRPFIHVQDAANAIMLMITSPINKVGNETFNVGSDQQNFTLSQVGKIINQHVPNSKLIDSGFDGDRRSYRVSFKKINQITGFQPNWSLENGIDQVIRAFELGEISNYKESKYSNEKSLLIDLDGQLNYSTGWEEQFLEESLS